MGAPALKDVEEDARRTWESDEVRRALAERDGEVEGFVEGPPTMNGEPHVGHLRGRMLKDVWFRLETMKGRRVVFRAGWDTQGLPVELQAEKELGLTGSKAEVLRRIPVERLVEKSKEIVQKYNESWRRADRLLGMMFDYDRAYWTYRDEYIEREWKYLRKAWDAGVMGEGYRVVAYCPSCQTSLSHSEVASSYETLEDPSVYYKARVVGSEEDGRRTYLIVWTTMPFTVVTDELIGVNPDATYAFVDAGNGEIWVVAEGRIRELGLEGRPILRRVPGRELEGLRYEPPLLEEVPGQRRLAEEGRVHMVVAEGFVDPTTGSGIVHLSPANGEEDFEVARRRGLPVFNPIDDQAVFTEDAGKYAGKYVRDADGEVVEDLRRKGLLVRADRIVHEYPVCWRSGHRLVFVARREYYYWIDRIEDAALRAAERVEYYYQQPRNRFLEIIKEARPWCISRERYWGTPLPVWVCEKCGHKFLVSSREEIVKNAIELPDGPDFELHRPWIDRVVLRCPRCGGPARREPFVLDTWHNSGAAPYASLGEEFEALIPAPFLTEGIDQTRGWAYSLLMEHVIMTGRDEAPFRSFLFTGHVLDENGEKMSKSKGNVIYALDILREEPVDVVRFYLVWKSSPIDPMNFSRDEMRGRPYQVLSTLMNLASFLEENGGYDGYRWRGERIRELAREGVLRPQDRWVISELQGLVSGVLEAYEARRFHEAARTLERFIIEVLSQRYIPLIRQELWDDSPETLPRRMAIYDVLAHALFTTIRLLHPISPYTTDHVYNRLFSGGRSTLLLERLPERVPELADGDLERAFDAFWEIVSVANSARMKAGLKRRWALRRAVVRSPVEIPEEIRELLRSTLNVRELVVAEDPGIVEAGAALVARPVRPEIGKAFGRATRDVEEAIGAADPWWLEGELRARGGAKLRIGGGGAEVEVVPGMVEFELRPREEHAAAFRDGYAVVLDTVRDEDLVAEGLLRDLARRIQVLRKERGYRPTDVLEVARIAGLPRDSMAAIGERAEALARLVRVRRVELLEEPDDGGSWAEFELDGSKVFLEV
ncbi:MAG: isoleucine--tRNA ligase [Conexivisphaera sp.]|jgi:isoleucyl-tRNA synthetase|nr:isoleucine--tRNA ligase [Conexivisphaerales archaeon]